MGFPLAWRPMSLRSSSTSYRQAPHPSSSWNSTTKQECRGHALTTKIPSAFLRRRRQCQVRTSTTNPLWTLMHYLSSGFEDWSGMHAVDHAHERREDVIAEHPADVLGDGAHAPPAKPSTDSCSDPATQQSMAGLAGHP
jgi:hypothetical protein